MTANGSSRGRGRVEPRTVTCKACGREFVTDKVGRPAWYCQQPDCNVEREVARRLRDLEYHRARPSRAMLKDLHRLERQARNLEPTTPEFKRAMQRIIESSKPADAYFHLAALSLSAYWRLKSNGNRR